MGHPDAFLVKDFDGRADPAVREPLERTLDDDRDWLGRRCVICHRPLYGDERKVHAGACARKRESQLQRLRRWRRRR